MRLALFCLLLSGCHSCVCDDANHAVQFIRSTHPGAQTLCAVYEQSNNHHDAAYCSINGSAGGELCDCYGADCVCLSVDPSPITGLLAAKKTENR